MLMSLVIDKDAARRSVEEQIRAATGLELVVHGKTEVSVFPGSYVTLHQVALKGESAGSSTLTVDALTANLSLLPIFTRRFEVTDLALLSPHVTVTRNADGESNWTPIIRTLVRNMKPNTASPVSFSEIRVMQGTVLFRDEIHHTDETIDKIGLSLGWPSISRSFAATGQFDWRDEHVDATLSVADFAAMLEGDRSGVKVRLASAPLKIGFDGAVSNRSSLLLDGTLTADSTSLRDALRWIGQTPLANGGFGRFSMKARANIVGESVALTNVNVDLDGNAAEGVLTYNSNTGQRTLQGTLAADALDLTPYIGTIRLLASGARDWNRQLFDLRGLSATDLDMRLSAAKVTVGSSKFGRTAIGANLRGGTLALSVGEAQIYGGTVKGSLGISRAADSADFKAQFRFNDVDLEASGNELFGVRALRGRGDLIVSLEASGSSAFALAQSVDGTATLTARDGSIVGFNIEQLLKRLEKRPLSGAGNYRSGSTPFEKLNASVSINNGIANIDNIQIDGPATQVTLAGTASIPSREYDLKGTASLVPASDSTPGFQLPFVVQGPWDDPLIFPDSDILIRRSQGAAPLLDSLKDHKTRDAVKAVIDRLTGVRKTSEPSAAPPADTPSAPAPTTSPPAEATAPAPPAATPEPNSSTN
ncbi:MAG: AsmA family protein [Bradyrhizobiaceae bacterium]|nr:MAG: AsmA family protein [Bradyrhizobiaceae bacterium]